MKKVLSLALGALLFASCTPAAFIQVVDVKGNVPVENNNFVYSDNAVKIPWNMAFIRIAWQNLLHGLIINDKRKHLRCYVC